MSIISLICLTENKMLNENENVNNDWQSVSVMHLQKISNEDK